jgi:hypothetical protein
MKKINDVNCNLKKENLNLIEENTKMIMNSKDIGEEEARIMTYRRIQIQN